MAVNSEGLLLVSCNCFFMAQSILLFLKNLSKYIFFFFFNFRPPFLLPADVTETNVLTCTEAQGNAPDFQIKLPSDSDQ